MKRDERALCPLLRQARHKKEIPIARRYGEGATGDVGRSAAPWLREIDRNRVVRRRVEHDLALLEAARVGAREVRSVEGRERPHRLAERLVPERVPIVE